MSYKMNDPVPQGTRGILQPFACFLVFLGLVVISTVRPLAAELVLYPGPTGIPQSSYYQIQIRPEGGIWQNLFAYWAKVNPRVAQYGALAYFDSDFKGRIELKVTYRAPWDITSVRIRPWSYNIAFTPSADNRTISFFLDRPVCVSVEFNQDTNHRSGKSLGAGT